MRAAPPEGWRENWTSRGVYKTLLVIFRVADPVTPPFLKNRPLAPEEFRAAQEHYVTQRFRPSEKDRGQSSEAKRRAAQKAEMDAVKIRIALDLAERALGWEGQRLIGSAAFASKPERERIRERVRKKRTFNRGPRQQRKLLSEAWRLLPQAKRLVPGSKIVGLATFLYEREFLWVFLWAEARALATDKGRSSVADVLAQSDELAKGYPYLGLTAEQIRAGLDSRRDQAARDTAERFNLKPSTVRPLLSKYLR